MRRSHRGRASTGTGQRRRLLAVAAALAVFGGLVGVTQISNAESQQAAPNCEPSTPPSAGASESPGAAGNDATAEASPPASAETCPPSTGPASPSGTPGGGASPGGGGLDSLGNDCEGSDLPAHNGFQVGGRCVATAFGEVGAAEQNPTLLIVQAPRTVREGQPFRLVVSTRNLVRDRFLPAAQGGYYLESSLLTDEGLVRGHFHTACRMLTSTREAADPDPVPAFFVATEDGKGGDEPDSVTIEVPGLPAGLAQCSSWAGDGSHRIPMMVRANQIPALDSVRIQVQPAPEEPPAQEPGDEEPPAQEPGNEQPPAEEPGNEEPGNEEPGNEEPGNEEPGNEEPPAQEPDDEQPPAGNPTGGQQPPAQQPGDGSDEQEQPGAQQPTPQKPAPQKPTPQKPAGGGAATPTAQATEPATEESPAGGADVAQGPPARDNAETAASGGGGGGLALTGTSTITFLGIGVALLIIGAAFLILSRRRRAVRR